MRDSRPNGQGEMLWPSGNRFEGTLAAGKPVKGYARVTPQKREARDGIVPDLCLDTMISSLLGAFQFTGNSIEHIPQLITHGSHGRDGRNGNQGGDETVFNGRGARLVAKEVSKQWSAPATCS